MKEMNLGISVTVEGVAFEYEEPAGPTRSRPEPPGLPPPVQPTLTVGIAQLAARNAPTAV